MAYMPDAALLQKIPQNTGCTSQAKIEAIAYSLTDRLRRIEQMSG